MVETVARPVRKRPGGVLAIPGAICYKFNFRLAAMTKKPTKRDHPAPKAGKAVRTAAAPPAPEAAKTPAPPPSGGPSQAEHFAQASVLFQQGKYAEARRLFEAAAEGASREMAHSALLRVRMCEQRLKREEPVLSTAEDHYNYAIALINRHDFPPARRHLDEALRMGGEGDHLHYALALCLGHLGEIDGACQHLRRAIEIHPRNRAQARNDPDFAELLHKPQIGELLAAGRGGAG